MPSKRKKPFELFPRNLGVYPYVWLVYIILPIINLQSETGGKLLLGYGLIVLFIVAYRQLYMVSGLAYTCWLVVQMLLIMGLTIFYDHNNVYMGFFSASFIGWYMDYSKFRKMMAAFAAMLLISVAAVFRSFSLQELIFFTPFVVIMLISPFGIRSMVRRQNLERELDVAKDRIRELVKRDERMRIARDLHDTLGHTLSLITLKSQLVEKLVEKDPGRARAEAAEIGQTSRAALRQVRELVSDMRALKVTEALAEVEEILQAADVSLVVSGDAKLPEVSDLTQNILSLCIKEAATNIVKHSGARRTWIEIGRMPTGIRLAIEDDGGGFADGLTGAAVLQPVKSAGSGGNGIPGMAERLSLINGSLTLSGGRGKEAAKGTGGSAKGALLVITVPMVAKEQEEGESV